MRKSMDDTDHYVDIMKRCLDAWSSADAERVAFYYHDELEYMDPTVPRGIHGKEEFMKYLELIFKVWPVQSWILKNVFPHEVKGAFSIDYDFRIANDIVSIEGCGMDRMVFNGDKVILNHVFLNAGNWKEWIKIELSRNK